MGSVGLLGGGHAAWRPRHHRAFPCCCACRRSRAIARGNRPFRRDRRPGGNRAASRRCPRLARGCPLVRRGPPRGADDHRRFAPPPDADLRSSGVGRRRRAGAARAGVADHGGARRGIRLAGFRAAPAWTAPRRVAGEPSGRLAWGFWHLPADYIALKAYGWWFAPAFVASGPVLLTAHAVIMGWLWARSGRSLPPMLLYHFSITSTAIVAPTAATGGPAGSVGAACISAGLFSAIAIWLIAFRRQDFPAA